MTNTTLTQADVAALLRFDAETNQLHWLKAPRGKKPGATLAGCDLKRKGKVVGRVVWIKGERFRQAAVEHLLTTGEWPTTTRRAKRTTTRKPKAAPTVEAPIDIPQALPELSRAVVAAAKPEHRGWLAGLGLRRAA